MLQADRESLWSLFPGEGGSAIHHVFGKREHTAIEPLTVREKGEERGRIAVRNSQRTPTLFIDGRHRQHTRHIGGNYKDAQL